MTVLSIIFLLLFFLWLIEFAFAYRIVTNLLVFEYVYHMFWQIFLNGEGRQSLYRENRKCLFLLEMALFVNSSYPKT
jgi:uncharacterized membrane protein (DUF106 family)